MKGLRSAWERLRLAWRGGRLVFVDEAGVHVAMARLYGRAAPGQRAIGAVPQNWGDNVSIISAMGQAGLRATMTIAGAVDGDVFLTYVREVLCQALRKGDVVVMDNLGAHKVEGVREAIEAAGASLFYLPPYSPDLNPIEKCWSKMKTALRAAAARTREALDEAISDAIRAVSAQDAQGWFRSCGYVPTKR